MEALMRVYIFKGSDSVYGLTPAADGSNLPEEHGPWAPHGDIEMTAGESGRIGVNSADAIADINAHGYHLSRTEIHIDTSGIRS
jgi:hypothetical protein